MKKSILQLLVRGFSLSLTTKWYICISIHTLLIDVFCCSMFSPHNVWRLPSDLMLSTHHTLYHCRTWIWSRNSLVFIIWFLFNLERLLRANVFIRYNVFSFTLLSRFLHLRKSYYLIYCVCVMFVCLCFLPERHFFSAVHRQNEKRRPYITKCASHPRVNRF